MLTDREVEFLTFLREFEAEYGFMPSYRQICAGCGFRSTHSPFYYVHRLQEKGHLRHTTYVCRAIRLTELRRRATGANGQECASKPEDDGQAAGGSE